jgi:hypothetical protein
VKRKDSENIEENEYVLVINSYKVGTTSILGGGGGGGGGGGERERERD